VQVTVLLELTFLGSCGILNHDSFNKSYGEGSRCVLSERGGVQNERKRLLPWTQDSAVVRFTAAF
jgi:hypothetical protein